jgi:excisionase family DNA binding protein
MHEQPEPGQSKPKPAVEPLLVRVEEAARILSLSRSTIYEMMDAGELPSVRRGSARRIPVVTPKN